jgi:transcriptional regulator with XRE-family HTH domain
MSKSADLFKKELAHRLRKRGAQTELFKATGIGLSSINGYMSGKNSPTLEQIDRIAEALGVEPWEMIKPQDVTRIPKTEEQIEMERLFFRLPTESKHLLLSLARTLNGDETSSADDKKHSSK